MSVPIMMIVLPERLHVAKISDPMSETIKSAWKEYIKANMVDDEGERFFSVTRTSEEISVIFQEGSEMPEELINVSEMSKNWKAFKVVGKLDHSLVGIMARLSRILASADISLFAMSTFDTDYILVKEKMVSSAKQVLINDGIQFQDFA